MTGIYLGGTQGRTRGKASVVFTYRHYGAVAKIIREIADPEKRKDVCEIIGQGFNKRSAVFDFYQWRKSCNG